MATDYQAIIDAIDAAILEGIDKPGSITTASGRTVQYRNLSELSKLRDKYVRLLARRYRYKKGFKLTRFQAG